MRYNESFEVLSLRAASPMPSTLSGSELDCWAVLRALMMVLARSFACMAAICSYRVACASGGSLSNSDGSAKRSFHVGKAHKSRIGAAITQVVVPGGLFEPGEGCHP